MVDKQFGKSDKAIEQKKLELIKLIDDSILHIEQELEAHRKGTVTEWTETQLIKILAEVKQMKEVLDCKIFVPSYPRMIVDSWDGNSSLAIELLDLVERYEKVTKKRQVKDS